MLALLVAAAAAVQVSAPVSAVTVFGEGARVVRSAEVDAAAHPRVEFPLLPDSVDEASIRLEASGADLLRVELVHVDTDDFPRDEARLLLGQLEKLDDAIALTLRERESHKAQAEALQQLRPAPSPPDGLHPAPKLNASGWAAATDFIVAASERAQGRLRESDARLLGQTRERALLAQKAQQLGGARRRSGLKVTAQLKGAGKAKLSLIYAVNGASWTPGWDLQYLPARERVQVAFSGAVTQSTGEDWLDAKLTLSTAVPSRASELPKLIVWKIGDRERFIPVPIAARPPRPPPPIPGPQPLYQRQTDLPAGPNDDELRSRLIDEAQKQVAQLGPASDKDAAAIEEEDDAGAGGGESGLAGGGVAGRMVEKMVADAPGEREAPPPSAPPPAPVAAPPMRKSAQRPRSADTRMAEEYTAASEQPRSPAAFALAPPRSWSPAPLPPESPAALSGGAELQFEAARPASVQSGAAQKRVPLFAEEWPVQAERVVYAALAPEAFLVGRIRNASKRTLPGGMAELFVGADPSGTARLKPIAPAEEFTLPLGLDRAIKPVRNVRQVQAEHGLFSKDEVTEYVTTIAVANPYDQAMPVRVIDQVPLAGDKDTEIKVTRIDPAPVKRDEATGELQWLLRILPGDQQVITFVYELKRPKGYRVHQ